jgi:hypothetical protein
MKRLLPLVVAGVLVPTLAEAQITQLLFDSFLDQEVIGEFYNGGLGGGGSGPGPNVGVTFGTNALAITSVNAGGTGNFQGNPSGDGIMFWLSGSNTFMNVTGGFDTGFSLYYSAIAGFSGSVTVWDGLDGTGTALATLDLPAFASGIGTPACPLAGQYCPWVPVGATFSGTAQSISFGGTPNFIGFDNITFGSDDPREPPSSVVPEPATVALLGAGLLMLGGVASRRRTRT